ncbi:AAA-domain-containing protein [Xylariomycetidae sp. FL0641]|nr:AAA-domain-containing protein [Xylariomycetidae sp. FL0641]
MYRQWRCASRSTALIRRHPRTTIRPIWHHPLPVRSFHASIAARAANDANNDNGNGGGDGAQDGGNRPGRDNGNGSENEKAPEESLFGDPATASEESHGRKRPSLGSLRSRTLRSRRSELPPIQLPSSFLNTAITRYESRRSEPLENQTKDHNVVKVDMELSTVLASSSNPPPHYEMFEAEARDRIYEGALELIQSKSLDEVLQHLQTLDCLLKHADVMVAAAFYAVLLGTKVLRDKSAAKDIRRDWGSPPPSTAYYHMLRFTPLDPVHKDRLLHRGLAAAFSGYPNLFAREVALAIGPDLTMAPPGNKSSAGMRRPVTVIHDEAHTGYSRSRKLIEDAADILKADTLHLRAPELASIISKYLGHDAARTPSPISQLAYRTAQINGRSPSVEEEADDLGDYPKGVAIVVRDDKGKRDGTRHGSSMDDLLGTSNRGNRDELWWELKTNAVLEELVHSPDSDCAEPRPLIVHVDDYNALNMDTEAGSMIIGKLRKIIDDMWFGGRQIVLVGTCCASSPTPKPYTAALQELQAKEQLIPLNISALGFSSDVGPDWYDQIKRDYLEENDLNLVATLSSLTGRHPVRTLGLAKLAGSKALPQAWSNSVLPQATIYRIAMAMIGFRNEQTPDSDPAEVHDLALVRLAANFMRVFDKMRRQTPMIKNEKKVSSASSASNSAANAVEEAMRRVDPRSENHEERLLSGMIKPEDIRTTFKDVHAPRDTIESINMLTTLSLIRPEDFSYGVLASERIPGCLLYGPPGTGKTLLAKAVAKESGANMIEVSGATINNMFVGESEKNVRALFRLAKKKEPLIIFIDEADALLGARGGGRGHPSKRETINQFLREWDGMDSTKAFIMVATNRPFDLDDAVLRRLPRRLLVDLPLEADRTAILRIHLKDETLDPAVDLTQLARRTPFYSGSDLKNVCVAAAMAAVKEELDARRDAAASSTAPSQADTNGRGSEADGGKKNKDAGPRRRVLRPHHFQKALKEIAASVNEDMPTLNAIRKFDEQYGDATSGGGARKKAKGMGFGVVADPVDADRARVRRTP